MLTVTRAHLAEIIHAEVGLSRNECADLLENVLGRVSSTLEICPEFKLRLSSPMERVCSIVSKE